MESPYQHYLGTNYTPTADEARDIQRVVDVIAHKLVALDVQINEVQGQLDSLQQKRSKIHEFGEQHRALLSPARKLTPDILEVIFIACLPSDRNPCMSASEAPMLLMHICNPWRQIAVSAPRLWAAIHIVLPNINPEPYSARSEVVEQQELVHRTLKRRKIAVSEWLGRCGVCPLSISIYEVLPRLGNGHHSANASIMKELQKLRLSVIIQEILPYHKQWRELDISLGEDTLDGVLETGLGAGCLGALKSLHVTRKSSYYQAETFKHQWKDVAALLPLHATSATFHGFLIHPSDFPSISNHAWEGLTELNLSLTNDVPRGSAISCFNFTAEILFHCRSLVTLTLFIGSFEFAANSGNDSTEKILLPGVTTLRIALTPSSEGTAFAKRLFLPSLTEIDFLIPRSSRNVELPREMLKSLLCSGGHIHTLNLCTPRWMNTSDDLVYFLKMVTDLKRLTISTKGIFGKWDYPDYPESQSQSYMRNIITDNLLKTLTPFGKACSDIICPKLEEFVCGQDIITSITEHGLKNFLKARKRDLRVANIRHISISINEPKKEPDLWEDRISLEAGSAVFFKKSKSISMSPFEGYEMERKLMGPAEPFEVYTEL